jgi:hypothetical protein
MTFHWFTKWKLDWEDYDPKSSNWIIEGKVIKYFKRKCRLCGKEETKKIRS